MGVIELLTAILTILTPILSVGVAGWADRRKDTYNNALREKVDRQIADYHGGTHAALHELSDELDRLRQDAQRHRPS